MTQAGNEKEFRITKKEVNAALRTTLPIMVTFLVLGCGFGILMEEHGFGPLWSVLSGIIIFSGTVQFVSISMLGSGSIPVAAITALIVSARHIFLSISMIGRYKNEGKRKWYLFYALCDESYAVLSQDKCPEGVDQSGYRLLVTLFDQASWILGSFLGGVLGTYINFNSTGIDFSMTALFTTVFIQQWMDSKNHIPAIMGLVTTLCCRVIFGANLFLIPAMVIIIGLLTVMRNQIESEGGTAND